MKMANSRKKILFNFIFIFGLLILLINDHFLKWEFSNWITGKLSDFTGVLILPFIITFINPRYLKLNIWISAFIFMFWKSSLSSGLIDFYNEYALIRITRVVDYSDYLALLVLPLAYILINNIQNNKSRFTFETKLSSVMIIVPTVFILMSEAPPKSFYLTQTDRSFKVYKCKFKIPLTQKEIINELKNLKISIKKIEKGNLNDRYGFAKDSLQYYRIDELIIDKDTLKNIDLSMISQKENRTKIYFNGFDYEKEISNKKMERNLRRYYKKIVKNYFIDSMKNAH